METLYTKLKDKYVRHALWMFFCNIGEHDEMVTEDRALELIEAHDGDDTFSLDGELVPCELYQDFPADALWDLITDHALWNMRLDPLYDEEKLHKPIEAPDDADVVLDLSSVVPNLITVRLVYSDDGEPVACGGQPIAYAMPRNVGVDKVVEMVEGLMELHMNDTFLTLDAEGGQDYIKDRIKGLWSDHGQTEAYFGSDDARVAVEVRSTGNKQLAFYKVK